MRKLSIFLLLMLSVSCDAQDIKCKYNAEFINQVTPSGNGIQKAVWTKTTDTGSGEHINRLSIRYKNKEEVVVEHKFCDIYNFETLYTATKAKLSAADIAQSIATHIKYSAIKPAFKTSLQSIVLNELKQQGFKPQQALSIGLPVEQVSYNDNVEYGIEYTPGESATDGSGGASKPAVLIFYLSVGGE
jgi:hypothetical protein